MRTSSYRAVLIIILGMLSAIGPFSIDMYLPAFPIMATDLQTNVAQISLSLSSYFLGISVGQLIYGPILDKYGRKRPLYYGLALYLVSSVLCAMANAVDALIVLRFFQAVGGCVGLVASRALVRDLFALQQNARVFSRLMLVVGVSPIIAPTLGGLVAAAFGWQAIFVVLALMAVLVLAAVHFVLPAGKPTNHNYSLRPASILRGYMEVFRNPQFFTYAFTGAIGASGLYAYIAGSPQVIMQMYGVSEQGYGLIFGLVAGGLILSSQVNARLLKRYSSEQIIRVALPLQGLAGLGLFTGAMLGHMGLYVMLALILVFLSCQGFIFPNTSALSMAPFSTHAGSASALLGAIQMSVGAASAALVSALSNHTAIPMAGTMAACALASYLVLRSDGRILRYKPSQPDVEEETIDSLINTGQ